MIFVHTNFIGILIKIEKKVMSVKKKTSMSIYIYMCVCICDKITIKINCKSYAYMYKSIHLTRDGKDNE